MANDLACNRVDKADHFLRVAMTQFVNEHVRVFPFVVIFLPGEFKVEGL